MALDFTGGDTDAVTISAASSINDMSTWTYAMWIYTDNSTSNNQAYFAKGGTADARISFERTGGDANDFDIIIHCDGAEPILKSSSGLDKPVNEWYFVAVTFDGVVGTSDNAKIFGAAYGNMAVESSSYPLNLNGDGNVRSDASDDLIVGNYFGGASFSMYGRMAHFHVLNRNLSEAEIQKIQYDFSNTPDTVVNMHLGLPGTGTQIDISGNGNNGSVAGAGVADHVPIAIRRTAQILQFPPVAASGLSIPIAMYHYRQMRVK